MSTSTVIIDMGRTGLRNLPSLSALQCLAPAALAEAVWVRLAWAAFWSLPVRKQLGGLQASVLLFLSGLFFFCPLVDAFLLRRS